jgi:sarcosine oxidase subunit delta
MILIPCPHCGARDYTEFTYGGDAKALRPADPAAVALGTWADSVYVRDNPRGPHWELWQHGSGCRQWIAVHRDTYTHDVLDALTMDDFRARAQQPPATAEPS